MHLQEYLSRIAVVIDDFRPTLEVLSAIMVGHMNYIPFENLSIVLGEKIEFDDTKIFEKLVSEKRGGYCFEQNALLKSALDELGFVVEWLLCRVRWGKVPESFEAGSTFTHVALKVTIPSSNEVYLADVGFAGTNSVAPVEMTVGDTLQTLPEGVFRVTTSASGSYSQLENQDRDDPSIFRPLYKWVSEAKRNELKHSTLLHQSATSKTNISLSLRFATSATQ